MTVDQVLGRADGAIAGKFHDQPLVEASIRQTLGKIYQSRARTEKAVEHWKRALELRRAHLGNRHAETIVTLEELAWGLSGFSPGEAESFFQEVLAIRGRTAGPDDPETIRATVGVALFRMNYRDLLADARALMEPALERARRVLGPDDPLTRKTMRRFGELLRRQGRSSNAQALLEELVTRHRRLCGPNHPLTLDAARELAEVFTQRGEPERAQALFEDVLQRQRRVLGGPEQLDVRLSMIGLAGLLWQQGDRGRARNLLEDVRRVAAAERPWIGGCLTTRSSQTLARALTAARSGAPERARALYAEALDITGHGFGPDHPILSWVRNELAWSLMASAGAESNAAALALAEAAAAAAPKNGSCWTTLGVARYGSGDWEKAIAALEHAEELLREEEFGRTGLFLAMAHARLGRAGRALDYFDRSVTWTERHAPADPELLRFRAEAEAVLLFAQRDDTFPTDPFAR
jgi:tetratricopeptide (TPR) repeat protein